MTQDVFSQPGTVYLVHGDPKVIAADYLKIRTLEVEGGIWLRVNSWGVIVSLDEMLDCKSW